MSMILPRDKTQTHYASDSKDKSNERNPAERLGLPKDAMFNEWAHRVLDEIEKAQKGPVPTVHW